MLAESLVLSLTSIIIAVDRELAAYQRSVDSTAWQQSVLLIRLLQYQAPKPDRQQESTVDGHH